MGGFQAAGSHNQQSSVEVPRQQCRHVCLSVCVCLSTSDSLSVLLSVCLDLPVCIRWTDRSISRTSRYSMLYTYTAVGLLRAATTEYASSM